MNTLLLTCLIISFLVTLLLTRWWINRAKKVGLVAKDMHKFNRKVAEMGGIPVLFGFVVSLLLYMGIRTFIFGAKVLNIQILAVVGTITMVAIIGIIDDILGWKIGLRAYQKPIMMLFAALPLMMTNVGNATINIPLFGNINLGIIYPLLIIPIAISGAANGFNLIAGYNGLEAGMGIIILSVLGYIAWLTGFGYVAMISLVMVLALLAFLLYNKCPAKIFPGNTLTFTVGALIAIIAILGDMERIALILFIPYFIEFVLKAKGAWRKESFARLKPDGSIGMPYKTIYGLEHFMIKIIKRIKNKVYENDVVYSLYFLELFLALIVIIMAI